MEIGKVVSAEVVKNFFDSPHIVTIAPHVVQVGIRGLFETIRKKEDGQWYYEGLKKRINFVHK